MNTMSNPNRWKRRTPTPAEVAANRAPEEPVVAIDIDRLQRSLQSPRFVMPSGLTPEQKRQFMLAVAHGHR
jgi:hypothetical protein